MGNRSSVPRTPYEILGITELSTLQETKKAYYRLSSQNRDRPEELLKLNDAYARCRTTLAIDIYTRARLDAEYARYAPDFFERLELVYGIKGTIGRFGDPDYAVFYRFWNTFQHEDSEVERKIRNIIWYIKSKDPRIPKAVPSLGSVGKTRPGEKKRDPKAKKWKMYCVPCRKGFNSENTLRDHLKSKQHCENMKLNDGGDAIVYNEENESGHAGASGSIGAACENELGGIAPENNLKAQDTRRSEPEEKDDGSASIKDGGSTGAMSDEFPGTSSGDINIDHIKAMSIKRATRSPKKNAKEQPLKAAVAADSHATEHEAFRTCFHCKEVLRTRGDLILHIKNKHS